MSRANALLILLTVAVASCARGTPSARSTATLAEPRDIDREISALKLSELCAGAADRFWHRYGFDKPVPKAPNTNEDWSYYNHYNIELRRCLIAVRLQTILPSGSMSVSTEVSDAIEGGDQPMAILMTHASEITADTKITGLLKYGKRLDATNENLEWFRALMSK